MAYSEWFFNDQSHCNATVFRAKERSVRSINECSVAVVGGAGFLGSHMVNHLVEDRNCRVVVLDNLCVGRKEFVHPKAEFVHHDVSGSEERMRRIFERRNVKCVFNYAAWPYVPDSFARPLHVADVNFMGAIKVINAAHEAGCEAILQVSSAELYGDKCAYQDKLSESAPVTPHSTYGVTKAAVDYYCQCAWMERNVPVVAVRQFNCVGERETHPYVVPEIIGQLHEQQGWIDTGMVGTGTQEIPGKTRIERGRVLRVRTPSKGDIRLGNNSTRDFLYAGDAVRLAVELLERGKFGEVYNLGSEQCIKIYDLAKLIGEIMGFADVGVVQDPQRIRPWEIWRLQSNNAKLYGTIGRRDLTPLKDGLRSCVQWFWDNGSKWPWE